MPSTTSSAFVETENDEVAFAHFMDGPGSMDELIEIPAAVPTSSNVAENNKTTEATPSRVDTVMRYDSSPVTGESQQHVENFKRGSRQLGAHALIHSARDTLELRLAETLAKLGPLIHYRKLPLVMQFQKLSPSMVAPAGLAAMFDILHHKKVTSPPKLLCLAHIVYSLSLVLPEKPDFEWWTGLFTQTVSYGSWLPQGERFGYIQIVDFL
ncbi:casein kinase I [Epichloe bromicola]|uniref:Casein kinase I n=1 Tax=Epichloe bromicola TaxID=79588 RepID=A0ABQ0CDT4_9HYPO